MHGRRKFKEGEGPSPEEAAATAAKYAKYLKLLRAAVANRNAKSPAVWTLNTKLLSLNPDAYTLWNQRKELLVDGFQKVESTAACAAGIQTELELTQAALRDRNPKSYPTWHHRQWLATLCLAGKAPGVTDGDAAAEGDTAPPAWVARCAGAMSVEAELELCGQFLALDERNFHCWNYRRALVQLGGVDLASELQFTDTLIKRNFSNYSAWQYRASLLTALGRVDVETLAGEFDTLKQAMFTEPDDQTAWFYHRWCVRAGQAHVASTPSDAEAWTAHLAVQCTALQELRALEPASKWPLHALAFLQRILGEGDPDAAYAELAAMDPWHAAFYAHAASGTGAFFGLPP